MTSPSPKAGRKKLTLTVRAQQLGTIIKLSDHSWREIERATQTISKQLRPGLYQVEARFSRQSWSSFVALRDKDITIEVPELNIKSAVPLGKFIRSHESHMALTQTASKETHVKDGKGATILLVSRNWSPDDSASEGLADVTLERWRGDSVAAVAKNGEVIRYGDAIAACRVVVNPGTFVLSVQSPQGRTAQAITALKGWETQAFVLQDFTDRERSTSPSSKQSPPSLSVTQAIVEPGLADSQTYELLEAGQNALAEHRAALGPVIFERIARGKWENPILGLLAAHILLMAPQLDTAKQSFPIVRFDPELFDEIVQNTGKLIGKDHPDIIALRTKSENTLLAADTRISRPPLLDRSWDLLLEASKAGYPELVPTSLWHRVRGHSNHSPFFTWARADSVFASQQRQSMKRLIEDIERVAVQADSAIPADVAQAAEPNVPSKERVPKPDFLQGSSAYGQDSPYQAIQGAETVEQALVRAARFTKIPYSAALSMFDMNTLKKMVEQFKS